MLCGVMVRCWFWHPGYPLSAIRFFVVGGVCQVATVTNEPAALNDCSLCMQEDRPSVGEPPPGLAAEHLGSPVLCDCRVASYNPASSQIATSNDSAELSSDSSTCRTWDRQCCVNQGFPLLLRQLGRGLADCLAPTQTGPLSSGYGFRSGRAQMRPPFTYTSARCGAQDPLLPMHILLTWALNGLMSRFFSLLKGLAYRVFFRNGSGCSVAHVPYICDTLQVLAVPHHRISE